jgi:hypothetical protein
MPPAASAIRYLFRDTSGTWRCASENGIETGLRTITGDIRAITFDAAIDLAHHYRDQADDAERLGYPVADEQWSTWAEQLEIWAARQRTAPGQRRTAAVGEERRDGGQRPTPFIIIRHGRFDGDEPTFAEMIGQGGGR